MSDLITTRKPEVIAGEIVRLSNRMLEDAIEVGRRFIELKATVPHGEWGKWLEYTGYKSSSANNMMRLFEAYGAEELSIFGNVKSQTFGNLGYSKALALLAVPEEQREEFVVEVDAEHLSVRDFKAKIKELEADNKRKDKALTQAKADGREFCDRYNDEHNKVLALERHKADADLAIEAAEKREQELKFANQRIEELENRPVEVVVQDATPEQLAAAENRGRVAAQKEAADKMEEQGAMWKETLRRQQEKARAKDAENDALRKELEDLKAAKDNPNQRALTEINLILRGWQSEGQRLSVLLDSLDDVTRKRVSAAVGQVLDAVRKGVIA